MPRKSKYSIEQRVQACKDYRSGTRSLKEICISLGTIMAFQEQSGNKSYTKEFKLRVVEEYIARLGSLQDLIIKYDISSSHQLREWISLYNANRKLKDYCSKREVYMAEAR